MKVILKSLFILCIFLSLGNTNELISTNLHDKNISVSKGSFKVFEFKKMIKNIKVSDESMIDVDFLENHEKPLQAIKVFTKKLGNGNILVTFYDSSSLHININITENLNTIVEVAHIISPKLKVKQTNGKVILSGSVKNQKQKDKILDLFKKAGINLETDLVDLATLENPDKMVRIKLYAVEVNNDKGLDLKNNWFVSSKNYMEVITDDGKYYNEALNSYSAGYKVNNYKEVVDNNGNTTVVPDTWTSIDSSKRSLVNNQRNTLVNGAIDNLMKDAVSLTGGLTGAANYLGKYFNAGLTLNYLSSKGVAEVLDETTLLTLENQEADFLAGGTLNIRTQTTTSQGVPATELKEIKYGLQLNIKAKNIVDERFIKLNIITKSSAADFANTVDGIPNITEKSITTNVVVANKSTIVLGGLINRKNASDIEKIPLLGDIPVLGFLFTSKAFKEGKSELVFFITPEIVDPKANNQQQEFLQKTTFTKAIDEKFESDKKAVQKEKNKSFNNKENTKEDSQSLHEQRVKEILGY
ncbi:type II and III secretion system protein [Arcobacter roscoffensis]|uniref:Type II and III secretion system protein n=1 Tax=Arcobacter roscoffensis TaxID=2961520 RepID=A0ABY5E3A3_9BACT|nr:type II and III secretion system protein [Arcobacter roscoffensis]UTJ06231.1 type II and III secretion system protein [Arcobacter roscoffensis]